MKTLLDSLRLAEQGVTIQTPTQTIGPDNAKQVRGELEQRRAIYETAIQQRGYKTIAGKYHAAATSSCGQIQSMWADGIQRGILRDLTISQEGFKIKLVHSVERKGKLSTIEIPGTIVESAFTFEDLMNSDFSFVGEVTAEKIIVRPDVEAILAAWPPVFFKPPSRADLSSCTITFVPR